jgi:hypothetical protein
MTANTMLCTVADYPVCGLFVKDGHFLMTNDEGGKQRDLQPTARTKSSVLTIISDCLHE